jgi:hypothetical protein
MANWYYENDGVEVGPVTPKKLKELADSGVLSPEDRVRSEDSEWRQAKLVKGLFTSVNPPLIPPPLPASPANPAPEKTFSQKVGEAGKSMAQRTAKQAERTKLKSVSLPYAYAALGKFVLADGKLRTELPELFGDADRLNETIERLKKEIAQRPIGEDLTGKAKSIALATKDKAEIQARQLQLSRLSTKVGEVAFENHKSACNRELTENIEKALNRIALLDAELETLSSSESLGSIRKGLLQSVVVIASLLFFCFPIGLILVWKNTKWHASTKWKWTGATFAILALLMAFGKFSETQSLKQLAEAKTQWESGNKDEAIAIYKQMTEYGPSSVPESERSIVYGRLIESDLEHGMDQSARKHAEKAISYGFEPSLNSANAKSLVREIREAERVSASPSKEQSFAIDKSERADVANKSKVNPTVEQAEFSLSNGRSKTVGLLDVFKNEGVKFHTSGANTSGTPLADLFPLGSRIHVGDREDYGGKVTVVVAESAESSLVNAVLLATPFDIGKPIKRGNDVTALSAAVRAVLPEFNLKQFIKENTLKLTTGGIALTHHGKAVVSLKKMNNEMQVRIDLLPE